MNSIWNKNKTLFTSRFPQLAELFASLIFSVDESFSAVTDSTADENEFGTSDIRRTMFPFWDVSVAKNGSPTASENGSLLHSSYNPEREAEKLCVSAVASASASGSASAGAYASASGSTSAGASVNASTSAGASASANGADVDAGIFYGFGLGYAPAAFAKKFPDKTMILIEPDAMHFFAALALTDWETVFKHPRLAIALACPPDQVLPLITQQKIDRCAFCSVPSQTAHAQEYFSILQTLVERNRNAVATNTATLEKFAKRWQRNSCKNLRQLELCDGVNIYAGNAAASGGTSASASAAVSASASATVCDFVSATASASANHSTSADSSTVGTLPFLVLAAGPSLAEILPHLAELKKRSVVVAVDTALRACLSVNVEPDFIVLTDPQYYAWRHIAGLAAPHSVLIAESAVYPAVFRFECRRTVLCSSLFPLGQFFEKSIGAKGDLGSGGSVSSVAWNFAKMCGAAEIFCAGLDLAFPKKQTHVPGSTFEQEAHIATNRLATVDTANTASLCSPLREKGIDYSGREVVTDKRMKLFAWWFESRLAACPEIKTYTFSESGLAIPGITPTKIDALLSRPLATETKKAFFAKSEAAFANVPHTSESTPSERHLKFEAALTHLQNGLSELAANAKRGRTLCGDALKKSGDISCQKILPELQKIDNAISASSIKEIASLVFPTERQLEKLFASDDVLKNFQNNQLRASVRKSEIVYKTLVNAVEEYLYWL